MALKETFLRFTAATVVVFGLGACGKPEQQFEVNSQPRATQETPSATAPPVPTLRRVEPVDQQQVPYLSQEQLSRLQECTPHLSPAEAQVRGCTNTATP